MGGEGAPNAVARGPQVGGRGDEIEVAVRVVVLLKRQRCQRRRQRRRPPRRGTPFSSRSGGPPTAPRHVIDEGRRGFAQAAGQGQCTGLPRLLLPWAPRQKRRGTPFRRGTLPTHPSLVAFPASASSPSPPLGGAATSGERLRGVRRVPRRCRGGLPRGRLRGAQHCGRAGGRELVRAGGPAGRGRDHRHPPLRPRHQVPLQGDRDKRPQARCAGERNETATKAATKRARGAV